MAAASRSGPRGRLFVPYPEYSSREVAADRAIHFIGVTLGIAGAIAIITLAAIKTGLVVTMAVSAYAGGLLAMLVFSALYNLWEESAQKEWLRRADRASIFVLIAATATPIAVAAEGEFTKVAIAVIWLLALTGVGVKLFLPRRFESVITALYVALGWGQVVALWGAIGTLPTAVISLMGAGGITYSLGVPFHLWHSLPYHNAIWHGFVLVASGLFYAAILSGIVLHGSV